MSEQCKVSEPAELADDTEGEGKKDQVTGFSSFVAQAGTSDNIKTNDGTKDP